MKVQHKQVRASDPRHALNPYSRESRRKNAEPQDLNAEPAQQASFGGVMNETVEGMFPQDDGEANAGVENLRIEDAHGSATSWTGDDKNDGRTNTAKSRAQGESATLHNFQLDSLNEALAELSSEDKT